MNADAKESSLTKVSEEAENYENEESGWQSIPDSVLEDILDSLPIRNRFRAGATCKSWYRVFQSRRSWRTFIYRDLMFTRRRYTFQGLQHSIDHYRLRFLVNNTTRLWRNFVIKEAVLGSNINRIFNQHEFLRVLTNFTEYYERQNDNPLAGIQWFEFNWHLQFHTCGVKEPPTTRGTGGQVLQGVKLLLSHLRGLKTLCLRQLLLEAQEATAFMNDLLEYFGQTLECLCVRNLTKHAYSFLHFGLFLNIRKLLVSPQHLNEDVVSLIGSNTSILDLVIAQDENTRGCTAVSAETWRRFRQDAPHIRVHLRCDRRCNDEIVWQPAAPVVSIIYENPAAKLTIQAAMFITDNYANTLETYVQKGLHRQYRSRSFHERADAAVVCIVRSCVRLSTLAIRERLSTASLLLLAYLRFRRPLRLLVRRNAVIKRSDWFYNTADWTRQCYLELRRDSRDYELTELRVANFLDKRDWRMLNDNDYVHLFRKITIAVV